MPKVENCAFLLVKKRNFQPTWVYIKEQICLSLNLYAKIVNNPSKN